MTMEWPRGTGDMAARIRAHDWSTTPLGPVEAWPRSLRTQVDLVLAHGFPMILLWGLDRIALYNDAYVPMLGEKHAATLGRSLHAVWPEVWDSNEPLIQRAWAGETIVLKDASFPNARHGLPEDAWYDMAVNPLLDDAGEVGGVLMTVFDTTARMLAKRRRDDAVERLKASEERQIFLLKLSDALRPLVDPAAVQIEAMRILIEQNGTQRAQYWELDPHDHDYFTSVGVYGPGTELLPQRLRPKDFGPFVHKTLFAGRSIVIDDVQADPRLDDAERDAHAAADIGSCIGVPLMKEGRFVAGLSVYHPVPHVWTAQELALAAEVTERTWDAVGRARAESALRETELRLQQFGEASQDVLWSRDAETFQWEYLTPAFETIYGIDREAALRGDNMVGWLELIIPEDRERAARSLRRVYHGEWVTFEYRIRRPVDGRIRWLRNTDFPIQDASGKVVRIAGIGHDITTLKETERALAESRERQRVLLDGIPQLVWRGYDGGRWTWASPQWTHFTGQAEADSHEYGWLDVVHPDDRERVCAIWEGAVDRGELTAEYRICHREEGRYRWFQSRATPVRDDQGLVIEWLGTSTDVDDLRSLQERQQVLVTELQHRTFNLMGVVRSMADATLRSSASLEDFKPKFRDRVDALARVQRLLSRLKEGDRITFDELIRSELTAAGALQQDDGRVTLDGPGGVTLRSSTVQTFAMAIHELTTNALKYGALRQRGAHLDVRWRVESSDRPWLHVQWTETGVAMPPAGAAPAGTGQGRTLIEEALPFQLRARTSYAMADDGVRCSIALPVPPQVELERVSIDA